VYNNVSSLGTALTDQPKPNQTQLLLVLPERAPQVHEALPHPGI